MVFNLLLSDIKIFSNYFIYIVYSLFIGISLTIISVLVLYCLIKLISFIWGKLLKSKKVGRYLKREIDPILGKLDWWFCLLIFIASDIIIEYWQELKPLAFTFSDMRIDFISPLIEFFKPNVFVDYNMEQLINVLNLDIITFIMFLLVPLFILIIRHIKTGDSFYVSYTLRLGRWKLGLILTFGCLFISILSLYFVFPLLREYIVQSFPSGRVMYAVNSMYALSGSLNISYIILYCLGNLFYVFSTEYFFRGYLYFELEKKIGHYAIIATILPFTFYCFHMPVVLIIWAMLSGFVLTIISRLTRTFIWSALLHFIFILIVNIMSIHSQIHFTDGL